MSPDQERFLREIHRVMAADGVLLFHEPPGPARPEEFEREVAAVEAAGFHGITARHAVRPLTGVFVKA